MKKLFVLTSLLLGLYANALAQNPIETLPQTNAPLGSQAISSGNWMFGGSLGALAHNFRTGTFQINLNPSGAYFVSDQLALGVRTTLNLKAYDGGTTFQYGISPMLRYYFSDNSESVGRWFTQGDIGFAGSSLVGNPSDENFSFLLGIGLGYAHFMTEHVAFEGIVGYTGTEADLINSGLNLSLGFQIYLPARNR